MVFIDAVLLCAMLAVSAVLVVRPRVVPAVVLFALAALWWPANNHHLEGKTLIVFNRLHGLTVGDLAGVIAAMAAAQAVLRAPGRSGEARATALVTGGILVQIGALAAFARL